MKVRLFITNETNQIVAYQSFMKDKLYNSNIADLYENADMPRNVSHGNIWCHVTLLLWGDMTVDGQVDTEILKNDQQRPLPSVFMYNIYVCKSSKLLYDHLD